MNNWIFSFADSNTIVPYSSVEYSQIPSVGLQINNGCYVIATSDADTVYGVGVKYSNTYMFYIVSQNSSALRLRYNNNGDNNSWSGSYSQSGNWYYSNGGTRSLYCSSTYIPVYDTIDLAIQDIESNLIPPAKYPFTLQNGYLFVYDIGSSSASYSFVLTSKSEEYSNIGSNPFPDTNQSYWFSDTLPEIDETTIPASGASIINWSKGNNSNIFGQTQNMVASISGTSSGRYLYIYNPPVHYKWSGSSNPTASEVVNYPIVINGVSENENWYIYDSIARLTDFNQGGSVSGSVTGGQIIGSVSSDGAITLVTTSGAVYTQNSGGSTDISGANGGSIAENINGLKQTLDNFVNQFIQLLSAPISHIQQLIQSGSSFFEVFSGLFDWLPNEVSAVIISGLIIMVVVGVLKMLL